MRKLRRRYEVGVGGSGQQGDGLGAGELIGGGKMYIW
jgi:hypothetical protein